MRSTPRLQNKRSSLGNYASPDVQPAVNGANESTINEDFSNGSEGDEYDDDEDNNPQNPFANPPRMPPYDFAKRKLSQLIDLMNGPYLDLAPHYQRGVVWTRKAMRLLIDSMRNGYYIPPVIFNVTEATDEHGNMRFKRTCVDGKQRLTSIKEFLNGKFPLMIDKKLWYFRDDRDPDNDGRPLRGNRKKVLPDTVREKFMNIEILCTEYRGLTETQEIELFQRVQLGKPLTQAEAFRATQGAWQDFAKMYERDFADVVNLVKQTRASGFRGILACFSQIYECLDPSTENGVPRLRNSIRAIELLCSNPQSLDKATKSHLRSVFELFQNLVDLDRSIFQDNGYSTIKTFSPMDLIAVCCLLSQKIDRPVGMLRGDILDMRSYLRQRHPDLRVNRPCWASVWGYIEGLEKRRGAFDGSTIESSSWKTKGRPRGSRNPQFHGTSSSRASSSSNDMRTGEGVLQDNSQHAAPRPFPSPSSRWGMVNSIGQSAPISPLVGSHGATTSLGTTINKFEWVGHDVPSRNPQRQDKGDEPVADTRRQEEGHSRGPQQTASISEISGDDADRIGSLGNTFSAPRMTSKSSSTTPFTVDGPTFTSATAAPAFRKRAALDLGANSNDVLTLETKRAKLRAGIIKQEKE